MLQRDQNVHLWETFQGYFEHKNYVALISNVQDCLTYCSEQLSEFLLHHSSQMELDSEMFLNSANYLQGHSDNIYMLFHFSTSLHKNQDLDQTNFEYLIPLSHLVHQVDQYVQADLQKCAYFDPDIVEIHLLHHRLKCQYQLAQSNYQIYNLK